jgi:predicted RNA-binding protein associated with RNAse of E/G family
MQRKGYNVFAVDLFLDVLVRSDAHTYLVSDERAFERAAKNGLISAREGACARRELEAFVRLVESRDLLSWLDSVCPIGPSSAPPAQPFLHVPVPVELQPEVRWTW